GRHPNSSDEALPLHHPPFHRGERLRDVAALVLKQVAQILVSGDAIQPRTSPQAGRKLEVGHISFALWAAQPVLLLGEVVVANACPMQCMQRRFGGAEIASLADWPGDMHGDAVKKAANETAPASVQKWRRNTKRTGDLQR